MEPRQIGRKWIAIFLVATIFLGTAISSPSVSAQEGNPPTATEAPIEGGVFSTVTPIPTATRLLLPVEQPQLMERMNEPLGPSWQEFNISQTESVSDEPSIAVDVAGGLHVVWAELETGGKTDVYYTFWDGQTLSKTNVSASEAFDSTKPQIVTDSVGMAHIVWQDRDGTDHYEVFYSRCDLDTPKTMTFAASPKNDFSV
jgi:hypothetical protein